MAVREKEVPSDVALLYAPTEDGKGARVLRARGGAIETGEVRPMKDGQAIQSGEVVRLSPRPDAPCLCDIEVLHKQPPAPNGEDIASGPRGRPVQVASDDYRDSWDRTFGSAARRAKRDRSLN